MAIKTDRQFRHRYTMLSFSRLSQDDFLILVAFSYKSHINLLVLQSTHRLQNNFERSVHPLLRKGKTTIPISHPCPMECWDCSVDCKFSINLEMQLDTGASDRERETLSRSITSLACHSY